MKRKCKHCGTSFAPEQGVGEFCCGGCSHVYELIRSEGLDTYYVLQDRVGKPVGDLTQPQLEALREVQSEAENASAVPHATLKLSGMSCMGCLWLVERLARSSGGCRSAQASLQSNTLSLSWRKGVFDLPELAGRLSGFGYQLGDLSSTVRAWSPLAWRSLICSVLAVNSLLLAVVLSVLDDSAAATGLVEMLLFAVMGIALLVGLPQFLQPVVRSFKMRSIHHDCLACAGVILLLPTQFGEPRAQFAWCVPVVLAMLLLGRMLHVRVWQALVDWSRVELNFNETGVLSGQRALVLNGLALMPALVACWIGGAQTSLMAGWSVSAAVCLSFSLYPISIAARYGLRIAWQFGGYALGWLGVVLLLCGWFSVLGAVLWMWLSGLVWMAAFVVWQKFSLPKQ